MKILLVFDCNTETINGASQSVANLYQGLKALGHDVRVLTPEGGSEKGFYTRAIDFSFAYPGLKMSLVLPRKTLKEIISWKPDVVHSNSEGALCWWADVICSRTGARHIHTFHTNLLDFYGDYFLFVRKFLKVAMPLWMKSRSKKFDAVIFPSEWGHQVFKRLNLIVPQYVISNGIHTENFGKDNLGRKNEIREKYKISSDEILLTFTGRVATEKNLPELLRMFDLLPAEKYKLMIVGDGPSLVEVKGQTENHSVNGRVVFTGMVSPDEMPGFYAAADIFVTASLSEIQPLTYVEAMASGLPVVCAYAPYVDGLIVNGKTGYAFKSSGEFVQYIEKLARNSALRNEIGENAKARVREDYCIESFARRCVEVYEKAKNN